MPRTHPDAQMHRDLSEWFIHTIIDGLPFASIAAQAFHDGFVLKTSEWQQLKQVGNAVPLSSDAFPRWPFALS